MALKHQSCMTVRMYGKNIMDPKVSTAMPAYKKTTSQMKKWKVPIASPAGDYTMQMVPGNGQAPGYVADWNTVRGYLEDLGRLEKLKKGYRLDDKEFDRLMDVHAWIDEDPVRAAGVRQSIIQAMMSGDLEVPSAEL